jgi:vacuolar-type H+-ATPase subunit H
MVFLNKAKGIFSELKHTIGENIDKFADKAEKIIQIATDEAEESMEDIEDAAENVWSDATRLFMDENIKLNK